tara:strand:- start:33973 stop:34194 length:222 start_codon:yes stop_codon:yes gene_type:complete
MTYPLLSTIDFRKSVVLLATKSGRIQSPTVGMAEKRPDSSTGISAAMDEIKEKENIPEVYTEKRFGQSPATTC